MNTTGEYDARMDSKKRITLRGGRFEYYHVREMEDGSILLSPRVLTEPFSISENALRTMDESVRSLKKGAASNPIDLSEFHE